MIESTLDELFYFNEISTSLSTGFSGFTIFGVPERQLATNINYLDTFLRINVDIFKWLRIKLDYCHMIWYIDCVPKRKVYF